MVWKFSWQIKTNLEFKKSSTSGGFDSTSGRNSAICTARVPSAELRGDAVRCMDISFKETWLHEQNA